MAHAAGHLIVQPQPVENIYAREQDMGCLEDVAPKVKHRIHFVFLGPPHGGEASELLRLKLEGGHKANLSAHILKIRLAGLLDFRFLRFDILDLELGIGEHFTGVDVLRAGLDANSAFLTGLGPKRSLWFMGTIVDDVDNGFRHPFGLCAFGF